MNQACEQLDDYLAGELAAGDVARFEAHCATCAECRAGVDEQRWIDGLLQSPVRVELESASPAFVKTIESAIEKSSQRAGVFSVGLAAAAVLLVAVGVAVLASGERPELAGQKAVPSNDAARVQSPSLVKASPKATVDGGDDMLVVPIESPYPDVTIVRMYPIYKPQLAANMSDPQPAGDTFLWPESL